MRRGAYVATPAPDPTPPDIPTGWDELWADSMPDALPPGYTPVYGLSIVDPTPDSMAYDEDITVRAVYTDSGDWPGRPRASDTLNWTATLEGVTIWEAESGNAYIGGGYYGAEFPLNGETDLGLTGDDAGKTLTLTAQGTCAGQSVQDTHDIEIGGYRGVFTLVIECTDFSGAEKAWEYFSMRGVAEITMTDESTPTGWALVRRWQGANNPGDEWTYDSYGDPTDEMGVYLPEDFGNPWQLGLSGNNKTIAAEALSFQSDATYDIKYYWGTVGLSAGYQPNASFSLSFEVYNPDDTVKSTTTKLIVPTFPSWPVLNDGMYLDGDSRVVWIQLDGATGEVTVINP